MEGPAFFEDHLAPSGELATTEFAGYDPLNEGPVDPKLPPPGKRPPLELVSIELVRRLSEEMASGVISDLPYKTFLPVGWYLAEYSAARSDEEEVEPVRRWVMVFDNEIEQYKRLIAALLADKLESFQNDAIQMNDARQASLCDWKDKFFSDETERVGSGLEGDLLGLARHVAQYRQAPRFFPFEERNKHNLDEIAQVCLTERLDDYAKKDRLLTEFELTGRFWKVFYNDFQRFWSAVAGRITRLLLEPSAERSMSADQGIIKPEPHPEDEPSDAVKKEVKKRDGFQCLCCGRKKLRLQIDHIIPRYLGGGNHPDNLQTLCTPCNKAKGIKEINFRTNQTPLTSPPAALALLEAPQGAKAKDPAEWEMFLRQSVNFFFGCAAVNHVEIGRWKVWLFSGNDARWMDPHKAELARTIREACDHAGYGVAVDEILFY